MNNRSLRLRWAVLALLFAFVVGIYVFLALTTTLSMDDYWYVTFWKDGLKGFLDLNRYHYNTFNGRVLVHVIVETVLYLGKPVLVPFYLIFTFLIPFCAIKLCRQEREGSILTACVIFGALLLMLPKDYFVTAYNWVSAFGNYVLPTAMILLQALLLKKLLLGNSGRAALILIPLYSFLCGATTEQAGFTSIAVTVYFLVWCAGWHRAKRTLIPLAACVLTACAGLLTVFLSPATGSRLEDEVIGFPALLARLHQTGGLLTQLQALLILGLFFAAAGLFTWLILGKRPLGIVWLALGCVLPFLSRLSELAWTNSSILVLVALIALTVQFFFFTPYKAVGALVFAGLISCGAILMTNSVAPRTLLPFFLFLSAAGAALGTMLLRGRGWLELILCALLLLPGLGARADEFPGYWHNWQVERENLGYLEEFQDSRVLYYNMDYIQELTYVKVHNLSFSRTHYLDWAGFDAEQGDKLYMFCKDGYVLYSGGQRQTMPAFRQDATLYFPLQCVEGLGGVIEVDGPMKTVTLGGRRCQVQGTEFLYYHTADGEQTYPLPVVHNCKHVNYLPEWAYEQIFGITFTVDETQRRMDLVWTP